MKKEKFQFCQLICFKCPNSNGTPSTNDIFKMAPRKYLCEGWRYKNTFDSTQCEFFLSMPNYYWYIFHTRVWNTENGRTVFLCIFQILKFIYRRGDKIFVRFRLAKYCFAVLICRKKVFFSAVALFHIYVFRSSFIYAIRCYLTVFDRRSYSTFHSYPPLHIRTVNCGQISIFVLFVSL